MREALSLDDILIVPRFSTVKSRADVDPSTKIMGLDLKLGVISSNMDTVTGPRLANAMAENGAIGCLHRFCSIDENVDMYLNSHPNTLTAVGIGTKELDRFAALLDNKCERFVLDVAHGASMEVVRAVKEMRAIGGEYFHLMVGNFATGQSIKDFLYYLGDNRVDSLKISVGSGSACITRVATGCGVPSYTTLNDCVQSTHIPVVFDGGLKNSGDVAKAFAIGASAVMMGRLFAACTESPSELTDWLPVEHYNGQVSSVGKFKKYRGSASLESYVVQGKVAAHRTPEGEAYLIPHTGPVKDTLQSLEAGLRSAMAYVGAHNLADFREYAEFVRVTSNGKHESSAHGKEN